MSALPQGTSTPSHRAHAGRTPFGQPDARQTARSGRWLPQTLGILNGVLAMFFSCFACHKVAPLLNATEKKCPLCGSLNGEVISGPRVEEGLKAGVLFNIDPKTGQRAKKKNR